MSLRMLLAPVSVCLAMLLAACSSAYVPPPPADIDFSGRPIMLDVARIVIEDRYYASRRPPHVEHLYPLSPASLVRKWAETRLVAAGTQGVATFTITDGGVLEQKLALKGGFTGTFGDQLDGKLSASLRGTLTVTVQGPRPGESATYTARGNASGEATTLESSTPSEREGIYKQLVQSVAGQFDSAMQREIHRTMAPIIRR